MNRILGYIVTTLLLVTAGVSRTDAGWIKLKQFNDPIAAGYFFDINNGLIGTGNYSSNSLMEIWMTQDGGLSWSKTLTPTGGSGWVSSFCMVDRMTGYVSLFSQDYSVWKTVDGGKTWTDFSQGEKYPATSIYATSKAFTKTLWYRDRWTTRLGGSSVDGGRTYSQIFSGGTGWSNGIDFADDNIGVATLGPSGQMRTTSWYTQNGGVTWNKGGDLPESWSIHAVKGTKIFIALSENDSRNPGQTVYWSQDGGINWMPRYTFTNSPEFTGHICGIGNILYVQTSIGTRTGLYRSNDLGQSWTNVGGPSNSRDTRFAVTGCGDVVYAFDDQGGVWKTTDGGDGKVVMTSGIRDLASSKAGDTLIIPIYLDSNNATLGMTEFSGSLSLNSDLLEPFGFDTVGCVSSNILMDTLYSKSTGVYVFDIKYKMAVRKSANFSRPVVKIKTKVFISTTTTTDIHLLTSIVRSGATTQSLSLCSSNFATFLQCGDSTLAEYMRTANVPSFASITPNPNFTDHVQFHLTTPERILASFDLVDMNGRVIRVLFAPSLYSPGKHMIQANISGISGGVYFIRMRLQDGSVMSRGLVIMK